VLRALVCGTLSTAQILILYARLHLACPHSPHVVRAVRLAIIVTSVIILPPLVICYTYASRKPSWVATNTTIQRGILIAFTVREVALCVVYIVQAVRELGTIAANKGQAGRRVMYQVIVVQSVVTLLDVGLIANSCATPVAIGWAVLSLVYVIKLKIAILNALKTLLSSPTELLPSSRSSTLPP
jgi:hypothetical protein